MPDVVVYHINPKERTDIRPDEDLPELPSIPRDALVVIEGTCANWLYYFALNNVMENSEAGAIAFYNVRLGCIVVYSRIADYKKGDVLSGSLANR